MTYLKAAEAGADGIDCATSCMSGGTSQPATESMVYALQQMGFDCGVDAHELNRINEFFIPVKDKFSANGTFDPYVLSTKTDALIYQIPGGMLSNLVAQLKAQNAIDRLDEVLAETPRVRADMGYPPLVTPLSQMVGVRSTFSSAAVTSRSARRSRATSAANTARHRAKSIPNSPSRCSVTSSR